MIVLPYIQRVMLRCIPQLLARDEAIDPCFQTLVLYFSCAFYFLNKTNFATDLPKILLEGWPCIAVWQMAKLGAS